MPGTWDNNSNDALRKLLGTLNQQPRPLPTPKPLVKIRRKVFFSFHYQKDAFRVSKVRSSWLLRPASDAPFYDRAKWETVKRGGDEAIKRWINEQLQGSSVTVVLIGEQTANRKWVQYEIKRSWELGKGLLGIRVHGLKDHYQLPGRLGPNPFDKFTVNVGGVSRPMSQYVSVYDWVKDDGYNKIGDWISKAATRGK